LLKGSARLRQRLKRLFGIGRSHAAGQAPDESGPAPAPVEMDGRASARAARSARPVAGADTLAPMSPERVRDARQSLRRVLDCHPAAPAIWPSIALVDRAMRGPDDLVFVPRFATSFDLTDQQTLLAGVSAAFGPNNTGTSTRTEVYGTDLYWKWKSASAEKGFPFVALQTEALLSRFEAGADPTVGYPAETLYDYGFYAQALWGFHPRWVAGLRGDWVDGNTGVDDPNDPFRGQRTRISPNLTWYPTEFSKLRLQYNYDHGEYFGTEHSVWMQFEFQLGAHSPHKF